MGGGSLPGGRPGPGTDTGRRGGPEPAPCRCFVGPFLLGPRTALASLASQVTRGSQGEDANPSCLPDCPSMFNLGVTALKQARGDKHPDLLSSSMIVRGRRAGCAASEPRGGNAAVRHHVPVGPWPSRVAGREDEHRVRRRQHWAYSHVQPDLITSSIPS